MQTNTLRHIALALAGLLLIAGPTLSPAYVYLNGAGNGIDQAYDFAQDDAGLYVYSVGTVRNAAGNNDIAIMKHWFTGGAVAGWPKIWFPSAAINSDDRGVAIDVDSAGNVFVAGTTNVAGTTDIVVLKFNSAGTLQGTYQYAGTGNGTDAPIDIACADFIAAYAGDEVYVGGNVQSAGTQSDIVLIGLQNTPVATLLQPLWGGPTVWDYGMGQNDICYAMAGVEQTVDGYDPNEGDNDNDPPPSLTIPAGVNPLVIFAGKSYIAGNYDMLRRDFDAVTGLPAGMLWTANGTGNGDDWMQDVDADDQGVYLTGTTKTAANGYDIATKGFTTAGTFYNEQFRFAGNYNDYGIDVECHNMGTIRVGGTVPQAAGSANTDIAVLSYTWAGAFAGATARHYSNFDKLADMTLMPLTGNTVIAATAQTGVLASTSDSVMVSLSPALAVIWAPPTMDTRLNNGNVDTPAFVKFSRNQQWCYMVGSSNRAGTSTDWMLSKWDPSWVGGGGDPSPILW